MKKIIVLILLLIIIFFTNISYATNEVIASQMETLNISSFIEEGEFYTKEVFPDLNLKDFFTGALKGKIDNKSILTSVFSLFGDEVMSTITLLREYLSNNSST